MALPQMTSEQRAEALERAAMARKERADVKHHLKHGNLTLAEVIERSAENPVVAKIKVSVLLTALPGIGKVKAAHLMDSLGIKENRRVRGLSARQRAALEAALAPIPV
jgi:hypothetical protein